MLISIGWDKEPHLIFETKFTLQPKDTGKMLPIGIGCDKERTFLKVSELRTQLRTHSLFNFFILRSLMFFS